MCSCCSRSICPSCPAESRPLLSSPLVNRASGTAALTIEKVPQTLVNPQAQVRPFCLPHAELPPWDAPAPMCFWHLASLDAPTVAVVWALAFAWAAGVLALAAWVVYVGDRLLDARTALRSAQTGNLRHRHRFHWRHRRILIPLATFAACAAVCIFLVHMPPSLRQQDSVLAVVALIYFTSVHSSRRLISSSAQFQAPRMPSIISSFPSKELLVGLLFTAACALPTISRLPAPTPIAPLLVPIAFFASLAWLNCHAIEQWESATLERQASVPEMSPAAILTESRRVLALPATWGQSVRTNPTFPLASLLTITGLSLACFEFQLHPRPAALLIAGATSALLIALLDNLRNRMTPLALRVAADLVLLSPALLIPLSLILR